MPTCYIVGAGDFGDETLNPGDEDLVIAADGGLKHLLKRRIRIDIAVGDFDSLGYIPKMDNLITLKPEKDDTDLNHALELGWEKGFRTFVFYGCTGGRTSHTIANIQMLDDLARRGADAMMVGERSWYRVIRDGMTWAFDSTAEGYVSVFCLGDKASGITIQGLKYPLTDAVLTKEFALGVSNEHTGRAGSVTVKSGSLLLLWEKKN